MLSYHQLRRHEKQFRNLSGLTVGEFDDLYKRFEPAWVEAEKARLQKRERRRAIGGGGEYRLDLETRLLMVMVWMRHYLTTAAIGYLFGVSQSTISRNLRRSLEVLHQVAGESLSWPPKGGRRTLSQFQQSEPDLFAIFDATEQVVNKPEDDAQARLYFSGKQRRSTCKTSLHVNEEGLIRQVSATQHGSIHDVTHLRQSGLLAQVPIESIAVADSAYVGLYKDLPQHSVLVPHKALRNQPLLPDQILANRELSAIRIKVENVIAHLKIYRILVHRFRHHVTTIHTQVFAVIAALHNWRTLNRLKKASIAA